MFLLAPIADFAPIHFRNHGAISDSQSKALVTLNDPTQLNSTQLDKNRQLFDMQSRSSERVFVAWSFTVILAPDAPWSLN